MKKNISKIAICVLLAFFVMVTSVRAEEPKREKREEKTELGTADKAANLERCKSSYRQLPESDG